VVSMLNAVWAAGAPTVVPAPALAGLPPFKPGTGDGLGTEGVDTTAETAAADDVPGPDAAGSEAFACSPL
jgi:hypothetical protein